MALASQLIVESLSPLDGRKSVGFVAVSREEHSASVIVAMAESLYENHSAKILVADANLRRPALRGYFQLEPSKGLADLLAAPLSPLDTIVNKSGFNFDILTAGEVQTSRGLRFSPEAVSRVVEQLTRRYDLVLFDMGAVNDCLAAWPSLGAFGDMVLAIQCEATRWESAQRAKANLESAGAGVIAAILNQRRFYVPKWLYNLT